MADNANALLRDLHAARSARRGGGPSEPVPAVAQETPAPAAPAARARTWISIGDSDDDAAPAPAAAPAREGVIEIFDSDSDDGGGLAPSPQRQQHGSPRVEHRDAAATSRRVTTEAIDLTRDSDDEGPRKRQRTLPRSSCNCISAAAWSPLALTSRCQGWVDTSVHQGGSRVLIDSC